MKLLTGSIVAAALAVALSGCVTTDTTVATPSQLYIGVNSYVAAGNAAIVYLDSSACKTKTPAPLCQEVYTSLLSARAAKTQIVAALQANQAAPLTALQALEAAYAVIQSIPKN